MWSIIHAYVTEHHQTDRYDDALRKRVSESHGRWIAESTLRSHLKRMADTRLLQAHHILVKPTFWGKFFPSFSSFASGPLPGMFIRYTLPGMEPTLDDGKPIPEVPVA